MIGLAKPRFYEWKKREGEDNRHNGLVPKDSWITPEERSAIINYASNNPLNGCKRLSYMMIDEDVAYVSHNTVYRVLKKEGLLDPRSDKPSLKGKGFDQPLAANEQWHIDVSYINAGGTFYYLCAILDGYSRFIVHWELRESMTQDECQLIVQKAVEKSGATNVRLISDNGPQFKAREFRSFIKACGMRQTYTSPYYPQSNGKIERWHKELKKRAVRPTQPRNKHEATLCVAEFVEYYNYGRLHSAIGFVTPFDRLIGLDKELGEERKAKLKKAREHRKEVWQELRQHEHKISA